MDQDCRKIVTHLSRIQGQIDALKEYVEARRSCEDVAHLLTSITTSFASARTVIVENMLVQELAGGRMPPRDRERVHSILSVLKK